jgi:uncharacterized protein with HEPN domain
MMYTMRNRVSHGYHTIDMEIVWKMIQLDLPVLHAQITAVSEALRRKP